MNVQEIFDSLEKQAFSEQLTLFIQQVKHYDFLQSDKLQALKNYCSAVVSKVTKNEIPEEIYLFYSIIAEIDLDFSKTVLNGKALKDPKVTPSLECN